MRLLVFLSILLYSSLTIGQTPDYFANDPKWVCGLWNSDDFGGFAANSTFVYYLNGDTVINGNSYHQLYRKGQSVSYWTSEVSTFQHHTGYYLRQENKSIRYYSEDFGVDYLLVSYDYQVGDTVRGEIFQACDYFQETIQKIDSVLVNTEYRKVFHLDTLYNGATITEGIGHQIETGYDLGEFISPLCIGFGFDTYIYCFGFGDSLYWNSSGVNPNCYLVLETEEYQEIDFEIYPNPAKNRFNISSALEPTSISILRMDGSVRLRFNTKNLDIGSLNPGIYIVEVNFGKGLIRRKKLLVE